MPPKLYESAANGDQPSQGAGTSVMAGTVVNNCDLILAGRVLVRIPSLDQEVWARLVGPGGGSGAGFYYVPRIDDEVLVAMSQNDPTDAFVLGGLWTTRDTPPVSDPIESLTTRVIKSGLVPGIGQEIKFDDLENSITITTSTMQTITVDPLKIELSNSVGTLTITLDNKSETIKIQGSRIDIQALLDLSISAASIDISAKGPITIASKAITTVNGTIVKIN